MKCNNLAIAIPLRYKTRMFKNENKGIKPEKAC